MNTRRRWIVVVAIGAASLMASGVAVATGSTGSVMSQVIGAGSMSNGVGFAVTPDTNTIVAQITLAPNSSTGWHTHPGKTLITVKSGTFTIYHAKDCEPRVYTQGEAAIELPSTVHVGRNETSGVVELGVVFFNVPAGAGPRIDQRQPEGCAIT